MAAPSLMEQAWEEYLSDHDVNKLLALGRSRPDCSEALSALLNQAILCGDSNLVREILELDGEPRIQLKRKEPAPGDSGIIYFAVEELGDELGPSILNELVAHGADINAHGGNPNDWTALHLASRRGYAKAVKMLLDHGADVNVLTAVDGGWTPLMQAAVAGYSDIVELLLARGADPQIHNLYEDGTAETMARKNGHPDVADFLANKSRGQRVRQQWKAHRNKKKNRGATRQADTPRDAQGGGN